KGRGRDSRTLVRARHRANSRAKRLQFAQAGRSVPARAGRIGRTDKAPPFRHWLRTARNSFRDRPPSRRADKAFRPIAASLLFRYEEHGRKRWKHKAYLGEQAPLKRLHAATVADVAAAVGCRVGVEDFAPMTQERHADVVVAINLRRKIN